MWGRCRLLQATPEWALTILQGETVVRTADVAAKLHLELSGKAVDLSNVRLQSQQPVEFRYEDGRIGMDDLAGGFTLDFKAMQIRLDESRSR